MVSPEELIGAQNRERRAIEASGVLVRRVCGRRRAGFRIARKRIGEDFRATYVCTRV
jgi:hypothetical protein